MGGPFWEKKDEAAWSIFKGEFEADENPFDAAKREFYEETGIKPIGDFIELPMIKQSSGKQVYAWAFEGNCDASTIKSNTFDLEWPPRSGIIKKFPEVDRAEWFSVGTARKKIARGQAGFIDELCKFFNDNSGSGISQHGWHAC
jgi:predicted NUDIX family NTP pyrophosphohydrolase